MIVAGICLVATLGIVVMDVALRYFFHAPISWAHELIRGYLMAGIFFPALARATRNQEHIRVDILYQFFPSSVKRIADLFVAITMAALLVFIIRLLTLRLIEEYEQNRVLAGFIEWPLWLMTIIPLVGLIALFARLVADVFIAFNSSEAKLMDGS